MPRESQHITPKRSKNVLFSRRSSRFLAFSSETQEHEENPQKPDVAGVSDTRIDGRRERAGPAKLRVRSEEDTCGQILMAATRTATDGFRIWLSPQGHCSGRPQVLDRRRPNPAGRCALRSDTAPHFGWALGKAPGRCVRRQLANRVSRGGDCHGNFKSGVQISCGRVRFAPHTLVVGRSFCRDRSADGSCEDPLCRVGDHVSPYR